MGSKNSVHKSWDFCDDFKSAESKTRYFYDKSRRCTCMKTAYKKKIASTKTRTKKESGKKVLDFYDDFKSAEPKTLDFYDKSRAWAFMKTAI